MLSTNARNAYHKAIERNGAALVRRLEHGIYEVPSATRDGRTYLVTGAAADGHDHLCDCEAGRRGLMCWHIASVVLRRTQEEAKRQARRMHAAALVREQERLERAYHQAAGLPDRPARVATRQALAGQVQAVRGELLGLAA